MSGGRDRMNKRETVYYSMIGVCLVIIGMLLIIIYHEVYALPENTTDWNWGTYPDGYYDNGYPCDCELTDDDKEELEEEQDEKEHAEESKDWMK